jgi:hypothetical protein
MARPKDSDPSVEWKVHIKSSLAAKVELLLLDPMRRKVKYGARSQLIETLLERWIEGKLLRDTSFSPPEEAPCPSSAKPLEGQGTSG